MRVTKSDLEKMETLNKDRYLFISKKSEQKLLDVADALVDKKKYVPLSVDEIPNFPYETYADLKDALEKEEIVLLRFSYHANSDLAEILNPTFLWTFWVVIGYLLPFLAIILGIFYSWWCIFGVLFFFIGYSKTKQLYDRTIFNSALTNEVAFCFLFYSKQISVAPIDRSTQYFYDSEKEITKGTASEYSTKTSDFEYDNESDIEELNKSKNLLTRALSILDELDGYKRSYIWLLWVLNL